MTNPFVMQRAVAACAVTFLALCLAGCEFGNSVGTSSSTINSGVTTPTQVNNAQPIIVDAGPLVNGKVVGDANVLFTTVTVCVPGTTTCQTIDHVAVDTGSTGLRMLASQLTINLKITTTASAQPIANCVNFADTTYQWGPIALADVKIAGEVASSIPIQVVGQSNFPAAPSQCSSGGMAVQTVTDLGSNGILGVGLFRQDCGIACTSTTAPPAVYYACPATGCVVTPVSLASQLQNPAWMFPQDNNGLLIALPQIGAGGSAAVNGTMIFGIGTQTNNGLAAARAQAANAFGNFTTTFNGVNYTNSFIDSGSNGFFFLDSKTTGLADCTSTQVPGFYCPPAPASLSAITTGPNPNASTVPVSANIAFSVANALTLFNSPGTAFNNLGGDNAGTFDWGLPFFFGRTVFIGIESQSSTGGIGPYWAY